MGGSWIRFGGLSRGASEGAEPRDVGCADPVAVGDRGQSLDVSPEQPGEHLGLCFAQLRELCGHVRNRAVVLAELVTDRRLQHRRGVAVLGERSSKHPRAVIGLSRRYHGAVALLELGGAAAGELRYSVGAAGLSQEAHCTHRQVVVCLGEGVAAGIGEGEDLGRAATPAGARDARFASRHVALSKQGVQMPAHRSGRQCQSFGKRGCC